MMTIKYPSQTRDIHRHLHKRATVECVQLNALHQHAFEIEGKSLNLSITRYLWNSLDTNPEACFPNEEVSSSLSDAEVVDDVVGLPALPELCLPPPPPRIDFGGLITLFSDSPWIPPRIVLGP
mmetsp:Transcript_7327/g.12304  ORF Transcript_7327/g.12304 Transcript_7327/m.12304 type:complete len:123 (+) Transcript_7327:68-436(+)